MLKQSDVVLASLCKKLTRELLGQETVLLNDSIAHTAVFLSSSGETVRLGTFAEIRVPDAFDDGIDGSEDTVNP